MKPIDTLQNKVILSTNNCLYACIIVYMCTKLFLCLNIHANALFFGIHNKLHDQLRILF